ncbi:MAG: S41 family peptidase [Gammaproteobacteria bacterium]|nr:S41 family peptidase [Gammaproteobacteria bacterium]MYC99986.1 S41 family peptidase [Gammaproteobacteria bacterium]
MRFSRSLLAPGLILAAALLCGGWFLQQGIAQDRNVYFQARLLEEVLDRVAADFVDPVELRALYGTAIDAVIEELDDPNTEFLSAYEWDNLRIDTEGEYAGVGLEIVRQGDWITVMSALPGTPGERAGIRAGDRIVEVEGESAQGWNTDRAAMSLRGRPGTEVDVRIGRPGIEEPIPFTLERATVQVLSVPFTHLFRDGVGYVPLRVFSENARDELEAAIEGLMADGATRMILDLRGNPGGLLDQGVALADLFLDEGLTVAETRGRTRSQNSVLRTGQGESFPGLPLVILINGRSASASEIVAGALQDHDRALVLGATSFGKGLVQTLYRLSGGNVLKLTTARWYTPSGRSIQKARASDESAFEDVVLTLSGQWVQRSDGQDRQPYRSLGGRRVLGGGGITPDLHVLPDTLTDDEEAAVLHLDRHARGFSSALFEFAVLYIQEQPDAPPGSAVADADLARFRQHLSERGIDAEAAALERAERYLRFQLEREIARRRAGREGEFLRLMTADPPLARAVELLARARSQQELFDLVAAEESFADSAVPTPGGVAGSGSPGAGSR